MHDSTTRYSVPLMPCFMSTPRSVVAGLQEGKAPCNKTGDDSEVSVPDDQLADEEGEGPIGQLADEEGEVPINQLADEGEVPINQLVDEEGEFAEEEILGDAEEESDSDDDLQQLVQTLQSFVEEASALNGRSCKLTSDGMIPLTLQSPQSTPLGALQLHSNRSHQKGGRTPQVGRYFSLVGFCLTTSSPPRRGELSPCLPLLPLCVQSS